MKKNKYKNFSLDECACGIEAVLAKHPHAACYQKWTCEKCGDRVTGNQPNALFTLGHHEDCGHTTDLIKAGCNYSVVYAVGGIASMPAKGSA